MTEINLFDENRIYQSKDPEILTLLGSPQKQAQMRYYKRGPAHFKLGKKVVMHGKDLNAWANSMRVETTLKEVINHG